MRHICIFTGARPNFVKAAPLVRAISRSADCDCILVYAGKADDPTLESDLFECLEIPQPEVFLGVDSENLNELTGLVMAAFDRFLEEHPVDTVIVVDDLASTMAVAIVAKKRGLRLAHLVAGTRSFDISMPKEINRLVIDGLSDLLFTAGAGACSIATREGAELNKIYMVGNILIDSLRHNCSRWRRPEAIGNTEEKNYMVFTINRRVLLKDTASLQRMLDTMTECAAGIPVFAPLREVAAEKVRSLNSRIVILPPLNYLEFGWLTAHAKGIITDSGNVAEEATFNNVPCLTINSYTEHIETVRQGTNVLVGEDPDRLRESLTQLMQGSWKSAILPNRWDGRTAERIVQILTA